MFTLKTQGVFERFQCKYILSLLSAFCRNLECTRGTAARSSRCGRRGVRDIEVVAELTRGGQCAKLFFDYNCLQYVQWYMENIEVSTLDKAEYQVKLDQLKELVAEQDYDSALDLVQEIDWRRVKNIRTLCMVADVYETNDMLEDTKRILLLALKRASIGKSILSRLVELCLQMNDTAGASEYYQDFIKAAPRDSARYLLQYKILKANQASLEEQIDALHDYKESEYTERWAYELAKLYDQAGMTQECIEECDDIILWFSEGVYVVKAMELKMKHTPLTPSQQEKYDHRFETMPELLVKEEPKPVKKKKKQEPEAAEPSAADDADEAAATQDTEKKVQAEPKPAAASEDFTSTIDLQSRLTKSLKKVIGGMIHDDDDDEEPETRQKEAEEDLYARVETDRYAPKLEPEQPIESGVRREEVVTRPASKQSEEDTAADAEMDFSSILEAQADAIVDGRDPQSVTAPAKQQATEPEKDDFDLSSVLESEVADILKEKEAPKSPETESAVPEAEPAIDLEAAIVKTTDEAQKEPESEPSEAATIDLEDAILKATTEEEKQPSEEKAQTIDLEAAIEKTTAQEVRAPKKEPADTMPSFDLEDAIVKTAAEETKEPEKEVVPDKTINLEDAMYKAPAVDVPHATLDLSKEIEKPQAEDTEEKKDEDFDLQALLAAEVSDMVANPVQPEKEAPARQEGEPEDLVKKLEKEADRTIEHSEMVKETPQDKRMRIMRAAPANRMSEEQKRVFTYFAKVPGMDTQILEALMTAYNGAVSKTSRHGNIAIMGRKGTGKTRLTEGLIKALCKEFELSAAKFARIQADDLNEKDVAQVVAKLSGGFLVIEKAGRMTDDTVLKLNQAMEFRTDSMILIIEDEKDDMKNLFEEHPEFAEKFDATIKIPVFTNDELVTFARTYAGECGYKMDEMGILALYTIIGANQSVEEPVSIAKVKEMVDAAIAKASKGGRKIGRKLSGRQVDRMNRIILYEKDFEL